MVRFALLATAMQVLSVAPAFAQTPAPASSATPAAPVEPARCAAGTTCITAAMVPIGTPVKLIMSGYMAVLSKIQQVQGQATFELAEDVVVDGRLIIARGPRTMNLAYSGRDFFGWTIPTVLPCGITVTAGSVWTQDSQRLPLSFGDPKTNAPNLLTIPMVGESPICRRSNYPVTAYVSGPPSAVGRAPEPPKP